MGGDRASRCVEEGLSRSFSGCGGKPSFPSPSAGDLRELPRVPLRSEGFCGVGVASRDSTGFGQCPRASCRGEAGSSGFLSVSDSDRRLPAELVQESQASSCVEECISACLSSCSRGNRPLVELYVDPALLSGRCMGVSVPLRVGTSSTGLPSKRCPGIRFLSRADRQIGVFLHVERPTRLRL